MKHLKKLLFISIGLITPLASVFAQINANADFTNLPYKGKSIIKTDNLGSYYKSEEDPEKEVFLSNSLDYYKVISLRTHKTVIEGQIAQPWPNSIEKTGKWIDYYPNGSIQRVYYYSRGQLSGPVDSFYSNGKIASKYAYVPIADAEGWLQFQRAGLYQEFYSNGKIKVEGYYGTVIHIGADTTLVSDPNTGSQHFDIKPCIVKTTSDKIKNWLYYDKNGKLIKNEEEHKDFQQTSE